jgi:hypothetical protein
MRPKTKPRMTISKPERSRSVTPSWCSKTARSDAESRCHDIPNSSGLDPLRLEDTLSHRRLVIAKRAIVRCAQHMVDPNGVVREREQYAAVDDADPVKRRTALDHQTASRRSHAWRSRQEQPGQRVGRAKSDRKVHADRDKMRKLGEHLDRNQQAIRPILTLDKGVDFVATWETLAIRNLLPSTQYPPDQPPLFPHLSVRLAR